ncbi:hypothetical protein [Cupriavidus pinatubonensis]|uniref:hypothetical protein n=1 Tax=Cupriavidus pinatubonensis TaxID=248026 RepID=UPI00112E12A4|nr:hypothetical protein [Cupriavidus pinatubonensis]TPQ33405.1 hypothetical protein C2U69_24805 [Cupriavidus pinatubonensis]
MAKTGIELPPQADTGVDTEKIKAHLDYQTANNRITLEFRDKLLDKVLSANFLVFVATIFTMIIGVIYMFRDGVTKDDIIEFWKLILPIVTTYLGYAIGKGKD